MNLLSAETILLQYKKLCEFLFSMWQNASVFFLIDLLHPCLTPKNTTRTIRRTLSPEMAGGRRLQNHETLDRNREFLRKIGLIIIPGFPC